MKSTLQRYLDGEFGPGWHVTHRDIFGSTVAQGPLGPNGDKQAGVFRGDSARFYPLDDLTAARQKYNISPEFFPIAHAPDCRGWGYFHAV